jgi:sulfur relay protein TusB/DsrH
VFWALKKEVKNYKGNFFALKEDFLSRGYSPEDSVMELVDYNQLIDLIEKNEKSIG